MLYEVITYLIAIIHQAEANSRVIRPRFRGIVRSPLGERKLAFAVKTILPPLRGQVFRYTTEEQSTTGGMGHGSEVDRGPVRRGRCDRRPAQGAVRITSYNVCYTKLLRVVAGAGGSVGGGCQR